MELIYILLMGLLNRLRGWDFPPKATWLTSKPFFALYSAVGAHALLGIDWITAGIIGVGLLVWAVIGWGKYFAAIHGRYNVNEKEFLPADIITDRLYVKGMNGHFAGMVGMAIRGGLMAIPLFAALSFYFASLSPLGVGLCMFLQGPIYLLAGKFGEEGSIERAEVATGLLIGILLVNVV